MVCHRYPTRENSTQNMAELSPYKLFPEQLREKKIDVPQGSYTRANLFTDRIDMTVPAKLFGRTALYYTCVKKETQIWQVVEIVY